MQLYTVKMTTAHLISVFDAKGKKIGEKNEPIPVTICDLPAQTARMYAEKNPGGNVQIILQHGVHNDPSARSTAGRFTPKREYTEKVKHSAPAPVSRPKKDAALTGDMSAAINKR